MTDPTSYLSVKLASMIGGLFGGAAILTFIKPKTIGEAFMRGGISVGSAMLFTAPLLKMMDLSVDWESQAMGGFVVGFLSYSILGMVANFLLKHKNNDIVDVIKDVKDKK